ncbi:MAG: 5'-3' exonuclease, partial [Nocardioides sp.]
MAPPESTPLLMAVDGNSLLHRAHHAHRDSDQRDRRGRPVWGLRGLVTSIAGAAARLNPDAVLIGVDCDQDSWRRREYSAYKAGRAQKQPDLLEQLHAAPGLLRGAGFQVVQHRGFEADDVLASSTALARREGWRCAVVTSDRDSFALIDETTSVLRVIAGGIDASPLLTPARLPLLCGVRADQYRDFAALRGDPSDNLAGVRGIGPKIAARLLAAFDSVAEVYAALDGDRTETVVHTVGAPTARRLVDPEARECVTRNLRLMAMDTDLPVPALATMRIPMDADRLQAGLRERDIWLSQSLWALTEGPPTLAPPVLSAEVGLRSVIDVVPVESSEQL